MRPVHAVLPSRAHDTRLVGPIQCQLKQVERACRRLVNSNKWSVRAGICGRLRQGWVGQQVVVVSAEVYIFVEETGIQKCSSVKIFAARDTRSGSLYDLRFRGET